jgi:hypothetical protein
MQKCLVVFVLSLWMLLAPRQTWAQAEPTAIAPNGYAQAVDAAVREFQEGDFEDARAFFAEAHALFPNARTLRGLGHSEFELRLYVQAIAHLEASLSSTVRPLSAEQRTEVESLLARARNLVATVRIKVNAEGATVMVDGLQVALGPDRTLQLDLGDHVLEVSASGHLSTRRQLRVSGGDQQEIEITLSKPAPAAAAPVFVAQPIPTREDRPVHKNPWLWTAVGVVLAGAGVATALALTREGDTVPESAYGGDTGAVLRGP